MTGPDAAPFGGMEMDSAIDVFADPIVHRHRCDFRVPRETIELTRPFLYMPVDVQSGVTFFIGKMADIGA